MNINEIIEIIRNDTNCIVYSSCGLPEVSENDILPDDLKAFYKNCGGISFFCKAEFSFAIVSPKEFQLANPIIVGELCEEDISSKWYIIGKDAECNYITIDLSKERSGRCYDSFWDSHGVVGECAIIANTFFELLVQLFNSRGESLFWLNDEFINIGDAYDEF